jgi:adenylate cyclase
LQLATVFERHPAVPAVRGGVAGGEVTMRDGDVFGPVVNLAARAVKLAGPSEVIVPTPMAQAARIPSEPLGRQTLKGFDGEVELSRLARRSS